MVLSDETLLAGMADRDQGAASAFVRRYQARVFGLALTIVGVPAVAEEVSQDVFLKAWRNASGYDPDAAGSPPGCSPSPTTPRWTRSATDTRTPWIRTS